MELDPTTLFLFGDMPREVGVRERIYRIEDFVRYIEINNGHTDCYTSVYPLNGKLDKIYTDWDGKGALKDVQKMGEWLYGEQIPFVPVVTGKKGYHLYTRNKIHKISEGSALLLRRATLGIIHSALGTLECTVDSHPIGDVRRICRIPNTLRPPENLNWCTYLPSPDYLDMSEYEMAEFMKEPHYIDYDFSGKLLDLSNFPLFDDPVWSQGLNSQGNLGRLDVIPSIKENEFLQRVLRPCLYEHIIRPEPIHSVRVAVAVDLLEFFPKETVINVFKSLGWSDWDPHTTEYQVGKCRGLRSYSCKRLRSLGLPRSCNECMKSNEIMELEV